MATETQTEAHAEMAESVVKALNVSIEHLKQKAKEEKAAGLYDEAEKTLKRLANMQKSLAKVYSTNPGLGGGVSESEIDISATAQLHISRAIILSALIIAGAALLCVVLVTGANWYYAEMLFALVAYLIWQHYL